MYYEICTHTSIILMPPHKYYVWTMDDNDSYGYLHKDIIIRKKTINNDEYSGFFDTREEARDVIVKHMCISNNVLESKARAVVKVYDRLALKIPSLK